jgi:predicted methyltransferase
MMEGIVEALRLGGRVVLLEYRAEDPSIPIKPLHKMTEAQVRRELEAVGLRHVETMDFLPRQHVLVFEKAS